MVITSALFSFTKELNAIPKSIVSSFEHGIVLVGYKESHPWYGMLNKRGKLSVDKTIDINGRLEKIISLKDGFIAIGNATFTTKDAIVIKFDKNMNEVWRKKFSNSKDDKIVSITFLDNHFFIVGETLTNKFKKDIWILKLNQYGENVTSPLVLGTNFNDKAADIITDGKDIFVTGHSNFKPFIIKLNSNLIKLDSKFINLKAIPKNILFSNKNILITGIVKNREYINIFVYKTDTKLVSSDISLEQILTKKSEVLSDSKVSNNHIILTGYDKNINSKTAIVMKIDKNHIVWKVLFNPEKSAVPYSILETQKGIVIAGKSDKKGFLHFIKYSENIK
jgi:hypothetical protein